MNKKKIYRLSYSNVLNPPPYLYRLDIELEFVDREVEIKYNKHFLDREEFSEEELEEEGFSTNDDFKLAGKLNQNWAVYFQELVEKSNWTSEKPSEGFGYTLCKFNPDQSQPEYLTINRIEYLMEEIYQAILETNKIEAPLSIELIKVLTGSEKTVKLTWHFKDRRFEMLSNQNKSLSWEQGQNILSQFYETDLSEQSVYKKKLPIGKCYINTGEGYWYETPQDDKWTRLLEELFA